MKRIGIIGFGFMGNVHFKNYSKIENAEVVAICDIVEEKLFGKYGVTGNIAGAEQSLDLSGINTYTDADKMFEEANLDAVSITLPTYLHKEYTIKALSAGLHVLCEKPMALYSPDCQKMIEVAEKCGKVLQVGHCIRFWPEYMKTKEMIISGEYGSLKAAIFHRLSLSPTWVWDNWLLDEKRSGGALLDLHIHDADFIQYLLGMPDSVLTRAVKGPSGGYDHAVTQYNYDNERVITAEGGWMMTNSFGFQMSFEIILEKAVICYDCKKTPTFKIYPDSGEAFTPEIESGNGYLLQLKHFIKTISGQSVPEILTPTQSLLSVKLIEAEKKSADSAEKIQVQ
jgi:predicted dehydrogenase